MILKDGWSDVSFISVYSTVKYKAINRIKTD